MVPLELVGGQVAKAGMWAHSVVVLPPRLNDDLSFAARAEPLDAQALVAELSVEGIVGSVLPGLDGVDDGGLDATVGQPFQDGVAHELRAAVGAHVGDVARMLKAIHAQEDRRSAQDKIREVIAKLKALRLTTAAERVEAKAQETLTYFAFPS